MSDRHSRAGAANPRQELDVLQICLAKCESDYRQIAQYYSTRNASGFNSDRIERVEKMAKECETLFGKISKRAAR